MGGAINRLKDIELKRRNGIKRDKEETLSDGGGLYARCQKGGFITWYFQYKQKGNKTRAIKVCFGRYPDLGLKTARELRQECREWLALGKDPKTEYERRRAASTEQAKRITVADAINYWLDNYVRARRKRSGLVISRMNTYIISTIGSRPLDECSAGDWRDCFSKIADKYPYTAGKLLSECRQALNYCDAFEYATSNALDKMTISMVGGKPAGKHARVLENGELIDIWQATSDGSLTPYYADLMRLLIVFGCRTAEARLSRIEEWDTDKWIWTVPEAHNAKGGIPVRRPVPDAIRPMVTRLIQANKKTGLLLGVEKQETTVSAWGQRAYRKPRFRHTERWAFHDLRRTFSTYLNGTLHIAPHVVEQLLGHVMQGVMAVYNRSEYMSEKTEALNKWVEWLDALASGGNVIPLQKAKN
ncbi:site-specific integrase [Escherichia coli]|uniref:tyrosine-type recombinase/integrase n=1 Tax=Escherichia coli TaxID=562 RepID=UPI00107D068E|nr:site-specific integrase [Escherichia coli]EEC8713831.1 site-specific integrase [Escherichia coli]EEC8719067.1 site-specific integrase [Escherichia coli]EEC9603174.1 site-specific integrase [Escherichia coli]EEQ1644492.1 site-specific integrase [Escherichia coli]EEQ6504754.1 site-specific integrase [Escherichia coli]